MRLRHTLGAAIGAVALIVAIPSSAHALDGSFLYQYGDSANPTAALLEQPGAGECINIPEVEGKSDTAFAPNNSVQGADANVYTEEDCQGTPTTLAEGTQLGPEVTFKSVYFEQTEA
ncbi:hypothetical protein [Streptomyces sp. NPDC008141]|uniref:hypothetical protein n=1 Tax=Streptomyces sp. NPDC008141 TaxID=3364815 RepID=UPI0036E4FE14